MHIKCMSMQANLWLMHELNPLANITPTHKNLLHDKKQRKNKNKKKTKNQKKQKKYFTSSDPHHDMLGGGCQVRVVIENMMGRMENLRTLISGFLGLVILVRWALVTMFLS